MSGFVDDVTFSMTMRTLPRVRQVAAPAAKSAIFDCILFWDPTIYEGNVSSLIVGAYVRAFESQYSVLINATGKLLCTTRLSPLSNSHCSHCNVCILVLTNKPCISATPKYATPMQVVWIKWQSTCRVVNQQSWRRQLNALSRNYQFTGKFPFANVTRKLPTG